MPQTKLKRIVPKSWGPKPQSKVEEVIEVRRANAEKKATTVKPISEDSQQANILLKLTGELLSRLDDGLTCVLKEHYYAIRNNKIPEEQFEEARRIARTKGAKQANAFIEQCRTTLPQLKNIKPNRTNFCYILIRLGLQQFELDREGLSKKIIYRNQE